MVKRGRPALPPGERRQSRGINLPPATWGKLGALAASTTASENRIVETLIEKEFEPMNATKLQGDEFIKLAGIAKRFYDISSLPELENVKPSQVDEHVRKETLPLMLGLKALDGCKSLGIADRQARIFAVSGEMRREFRAEEQEARDFAELLIETIDAIPAAATTAHIGTMQSIFRVAMRD